MNLLRDGELIRDITDRWNLATYLSERETTPQDTLKPVFEAALHALQQKTGIALPKETNRRIWSSASKEPLKALKEKLISEFFEKVLSGFLDYEIEEMLEEQTKTHSIYTQEYRDRLQIAKNQNQKSITAVMKQKALSLKDELYPEIIVALDALKSEFKSS